MKNDKEFMPWERYEGKSKAPIDGVVMTNNSINLLGVVKELRKRVAALELAVAGLEMDVGARCTCSDELQKFKDGVTFEFNNVYDAIDGAGARLSEVEERHIKRQTKKPTRKDYLRRATEIVTVEEWTKLVEAIIKRAQAGDEDALRWLRKQAGATSQPPRTAS
jgi:uncharacterized small protein (DUF1192 family)